MAKQTSKLQLLKDIQTERRRLEQSLSTWSDEELIRPGIVGEWSVKDLLAHLVACHLYDTQGEMWTPPAPGGRESQEPI